MKPPIARRPRSADLRRSARWARRRPRLVAGPPLAGDWLATAGGRGHVLAADLARGAAGLCAGNSVWTAVL